MAAMLAEPRAEQAPATYASALLAALARDEVAGRRSPRLTEPGQATWQRFRGRLGSADLLRLLAEDGAVLHPVPFAASQIGVPLDDIDDALVDSWLDGLASKNLQRPAAEYVEAQAQLLGVPTKLARSELHQVKPHQKVLELPGTGGQLCHHLLTTQSGLTLQVNCTIACGTWAELVLAGIIGLDLAAPPRSSFLLRATAEDLANDQHPLRQQRFDFVVGLRPEKGGKLQVADQLALWFHGAKLVLV
jgi:hypothetical protein